MSWHGPHVGTLFHPSEGHAAAAAEALMEARGGWGGPSTSPPPWLVVLAHNNSPWCQSTMWHPDWFLAQEGTGG